MSAQIQTLKAEIEADLQAITEIYSLLDRLEDPPPDESYREDIRRFVAFLDELLAGS